MSTAPALIRHHPTQPPSYKPPEFRKSQLHRQYQSLLRSSPLILIFQHNNIKSVEWMGIRRELATALAKVDEDLLAKGDGGKGAQDVGGAGGVKMQIVQTAIFASALKVVEFWEPKFEDPGPDASPAAPVGGLSEEAYKVATRNITKRKHGMEALLSGPLALLTFPDVSPQHLAAALRILAPTKAFPAPKRRTTPGYYEKPVQDGLQKLMLLGARVEGKVFDMEGARWVGSIEGGLGGLRAQLVGMLASVGAGVTGALEAAGRSLYVTVEGRRMALEEEQKTPGGVASEKESAPAEGSS